jgi:7,8-dihydroneopterin aldolase/epimerase/oxygenase
MNFQDYIQVQGISTYTKIGVADNERQIGQYLLVDLKAFFDLKVAGESDKLEDTVSYVELSKTVQTISQVRDYKLLESFGATIAQKIFQNFAKIQALEITIHKPHIPSPEFKGSSSVCIFRQRQEQDLN